MNEDILRHYAQQNPRRDVAVVGMRDSGGNVLLMRSHKLPDVWQPFGGGVDATDASPAAAAARELQEELGLHIDPANLTEVLKTPYDFGEGTVYFFEVQVDRQNLVLQVDTKEVVACRWFSTQELSTLPAMPATQKYLQLITSKSTD